MRVFMSVIAFAIILTTISYGQRQKPSQTQAARNGVITGKVLDNETKEPLAYANVIVYSYKDSSIVTGAYAERDGSFKLENLAYGRYFTKVQYLGYETRTIINIAIKSGSEVVAIGEIGLVTTSLMQKEVEVRADKEKVVYALDKKIVNIDQEIVSAGGSAVEALERAPSVQVDIEGNVTLRGSSNFTVFVNGKPSVLQGSDALEQIPASAIKHIELITNPSVKYDPDGLAGIINVVLKDDADLGINGQTNLMAGMNNKYRADLRLNWNLPGVKLFISGDYNNSRFDGEGKSREERYLFGDTSTYNTDLNGKHQRKSWSARTGAEFSVNNHLTMSVEGGLGSFSFERNNKGNIFRSIDNEEIYTQSRGIAGRNRDFYSANYSAKYIFDSPMHKLDFLAYYSNSDGASEDKQSEFFTDKNWTIEPENQSSGINSDDKSKNNNTRFQLDYSLPINEKSKFESGLQARLENSNENFDFFMLDTVSGKMEFNDFFSNEMDFKQNIYAAYATYSSELIGFGLQLGLRAEYTDRKMSFQESVNEYIVDRFDWFPSLHLSRKLGDNTSVMASYSKRIYRPGSWELDPFPMYRDAYNIRVGNPDLEPEYTNSYELSFQKYFGDFNVSIEGYYRNTNNKIAFYKTLDSTTGIMAQTADNLTSSNNLGVELMLGYSPAKWLNLSLVPNYFYNTISGSIIDDDALSSTKTYDIRFYGDIRFADNLRFELKSFFNGPQITPQGSSEATNSVDLGLRYDFFNRNASFTLSFRDIFDSRKRETTTSTAEFYTYDRFKREGQILILTFSYRFNNYKPEKERQNSGGEDIDMEMF